MRGSILLSMSISLALFAPGAAHAQTASSGAKTNASTEGTGGSVYGAKPAQTAPAGPRRVLVPGTRAKRMKNGYAAAPADAPVEVQNAIFAANEIVRKPYLYGGGHTPSFKSPGYDCSGTISYALNRAGLIKAPLASGPFMSWGRKGAGKWITVYANPGHAWVKIAGLRLDTSAAGEPVSSGKGPRWRKNLRAGAGYALRHPAGF